MTALRLALFELRRFRGSLRRAGLAFLLIVPTLYAGVYLWSSWNPYGHLEKLPVAVVNLDRQVKAADGTAVNAGADFVDQLKAERQFDWRFTDAADAHEGLKSGDYLFTITVPRDFSSRLSSVAGGTPRRASLDVTLDDANNYIVGIIAATAQSRLQAQVNAAAQTAYLESGLGSLARVRSQLEQAADGAGELHSGARKLSSGLTRLGTGAGKVADGADQVAGGTQELADAADAASRAAVRARRRARVAVDALLADHPELEDDPAVRRLRTEAATTSSELDDAVGRIDALNAGAHRVASGAKQLGAGIDDAHDGARQLSSGASTLSGKLRDGYQRIPSARAEDRSRDADVLANPVAVKSSNLHPAGVYGRGVAPFFLSIGLWVFGLVAYILLRPVGGEALLATRLRASTIATGAWLPAAIVGAGAATVLFGVMELALGLDADRPLLLLGLLWLTVACFTAIVHALRLAFGAVGEVLVLVMLVLQLGGAGGLYPLQIAPGFFDVVHPILPMTYTIDAFRHAISGGEPGTLVRDLVVTAGFLLLALGASTAAVARQRTFTIGRLRPELEL